MVSWGMRFETSSMSMLVDKLPRTANPHRRKHGERERERERYDPAAKERERERERDDPAAEGKPHLPQRPCLVI